LGSREPHARGRGPPHAARRPAARGRRPAHRAVDLRRSDERLMAPRFARAAKHVALAALVAGALLAWSGEAGAYPQFQFSSGPTRCNQCHYAPAGGGLLTSWGRDEAGDTISLAGDGALLHGAWTPPSWLGLGGDFRLAFIDNDVGGPESPEQAVFPMQLDVYV